MIVNSAHTFDTRRIYALLLLYSKSMKLESFLMYILVKKSRQIKIFKFYNSQTYRIFTAGLPIESHRYIDFNLEIISPFIR